MKNDPAMKTAATHFTLNEDGSFPLELGGRLQQIAREQGARIVCLGLKGKLEKQGDRHIIAKNPPLTVFLDPSDQDTTFAVYAHPDDGALGLVEKVAIGADLQKLKS